MGLTKDFFTKPIPVPCTLRKTVVDEVGNITTTDETLLFLLRREEQQEVDNSAQASILHTSSESDIRLARFSELLTAEPAGLDDFPRDERPLAERAKEYFGYKCFDVLIRSAMVYYDKAAYPAELFRGL